VRSAIAFSVPCNLKASATQLAEKRNRIYMWKFLNALRAKVEAKASMFPGVIDASDYDDIKDFTTFDERFTAPLNGFENAEDYWKKCSCTQFLSSIRIPTLLVSAADDPFLADSCYPVKEAESSENFSLEIPRLGGHVGFHQRGRYWSERRVVDFLEENQVA
jgi:predicted alpha/beta-fold hydrolase